MTALELFHHQAATAWSMLTLSVKDLSEDHATNKVNGFTFSIAEQIAHISEAHFALGETLQGRKHSWGTYSLSGSLTELLEQAERIRSDVVKKVSENPTDDNIKHADAYIVAHDQYHIGQIVSQRLMIDPAWDSYQIYNG